MEQYTEAFVGIDTAKNKHAGGNFSVYKRKGP